MEIMYHGTHRSNLPAIKREGLLARDTTEHNYPYVYDNGGVKAVYTWDAYVRDGGWQYQYRDWAILMVDVENLPRELDPVLMREREYGPEDEHPDRKAWRILTDIPPDRILGEVRHPGYGLNPELPHWET